MVLGVGILLTWRLFIRRNSSNIEPNIFESIK